MRTGRCSEAQEMCFLGAVLYNPHKEMWRDKEEAVYLAWIITAIWLRDVTTLSLSSDLHIWWWCEGDWWTTWSRSHGECEWNPARLWSSPFGWILWPPKKQTNTKNEFKSLEISTFVNNDFTYSFIFITKIISLFALYLRIIHLLKSFCVLYICLSTVKWSDDLFLVFLQQNKKSIFMSSNVKFVMEMTLMSRGWLVLFSLWLFWTCLLSVRTEMMSMEMCPRVRRFAYGRMNFRIPFVSFAFIVSQREAFCVSVCACVCRQV